MCGPGIAICWRVDNLNFRFIAAESVELDGKSFSPVSPSSSAKQVSQNNVTENIFQVLFWKQWPLTSIQLLFIEIDKLSEFR